MGPRNSRANALTRFGKVQGEDIIDIVDDDTEPSESADGEEMEPVQSFMDMYPNEYGSDQRNQIFDALGDDLDRFDPYADSDRYDDYADILDPHYW